MLDRDPTPERGTAVLIDAERSPSPGLNETHIARRPVADPIVGLCGNVARSGAQVDYSLKVTCAMCLLLWESGEGWRVPRYIPPNAR